MKALLIITIVSLLILPVIVAVHALTMDEARQLLLEKAKADHPNKICADNPKIQNYSSWMECVDLLKTMDEWANKAGEGLWK